MRIRKKEIENIIEKGYEWHEYIQNRYDKEPTYDFEQDKCSKEKWDLYYEPIRKYGNVLFELIECAFEDDLTIDNIVNALKAINVEVY